MLCVCVYVCVRENIYRKIIKQSPMPKNTVHKKKRIKQRNQQNFISHC